MKSSVLIRVIRGLISLVEFARRLKFQTGLMISCHGGTEDTELIKEEFRLSFRCRGGWKSTPE